MKTAYNSEAFSPEDVEKGLHWELIKTLVEYNIKTKDSYYNDIHITTDSHCTIVEWEKVPYNHEWGGSFNYVPEEAEVKYRVNFPDEHYEFVSDENEKMELIQDFIIKNPEWRYTSWGEWKNTKTGEERFY